MSTRVLSALGIYIGAAWTGFGIASWMVSRYDLDPRIEDALLWFLIALLPAVAVLASRKSWQPDGGLHPRALRWTVINALVAAGIGLVVFRAAAPPSAPLETAEQATAFPNADADPALADQRSIWIPFAGSNADTPAAELRLFSALVALDLEQAATLTVHNGYSFGSQVESAGLSRAGAPPFALAQRIATDEGLDYWVEARMSDTPDGVGAEVVLRDVATATAIESISCAGATLTDAVDRCTAALRSALPVDLEEFPDLPVAELSARDREALAAFQAGVDAQLLDQDLVRASESYAAAVETEPDAALPRFWYGLSLMTLNRSEDGLAQLREARRLDYRLNERLRFQAAALYAQFAQLPDEALAALTTWSERYPASLEAQLRLGQMLQSRGRLDEAASAFERAVQAAPGDAAPIQWLMALERRRGNLDRVVALSERALELEPENEDVLITRANVLMETGDPERAIEVARRAASAARNQVPALITQARAHFRIGGFDEADALLARAERDAVDDASLRSVISQRIQNASLRHDLSTQLDGLRRLEEFAPETPVKDLTFELQRLLVEARLGQGRGQLGRVREIAREIGQLDDIYRASLLSYLGMAAAFLGDAELANASFDDGLEIGSRLGADDTQRFASHWRGHVAEESGDVEQAAALFAEALALDPGNVELYMEAGRALRKDRRFTEAREALTEAIRRFPSYPEAQLELAMVAKELRQPEAARRAVEIAVDGFAAADPSAPRALEARALARELGTD